MSDPEFPIETERDTLTGFLDLQRAALVRKIGGVSDRDARATPTVSSLSLHRGNGPARGPRRHHPRNPGRHDRDLGTS